MHQILNRAVSSIRKFCRSREQGGLRPNTVNPVGAHVEPLEGRALPSAFGPAFVYVESNNPNPDQNAVLAFQRDPATGGLTQIGSFPTGGTGAPNVQDTDQEIVASPDGRLLFTVNQGSQSVTSFRAADDGSLTRIGSFDSGGAQPVTVGLDGNRLYVGNRGGSGLAPNYTGFNVAADGSLTSIPGSTVSLPAGLTPAQPLVSRDGQFVFGDNFGSGSTDPSLNNTIEPFRVAPDGTLQLAPGGAASAAQGLLLGFATHPTQRIVYAGLASARAVGVFTYDANGSVTFVGSAPDQGAAICWLVTSADGRFLYVANTGSDTIGVYSLADPLNPVQVQEFQLGGILAPAGSPAGTRQTADYQIALDPSGRWLYVVGQSNNAAFQQGNALHVLAVAEDGTVSEPSSPVQFSTADVPAGARPQGVAVVAAVGTGSISGSVFNDANNNGVRDVGEAALAGVAVYLDLNHDGKLDPGDPTATTDANGNYTFANLVDGNYVVREVSPSGFRRTAPVADGVSVTVSSSQIAAGPLFGDVKVSSVTLDFSYLVKLAANYGQAGTFATGDLNGDGIVGFDDLLLVARNFGHSLP